MSATASVCLRAPHQRNLFTPWQVAMGKRGCWGLPESKITHGRRWKAWEANGWQRHKQETLLHVAALLSPG